MRSKINKQSLEKIEYLFLRAKKIKQEKLARKYISLARKIAIRKNIKLPRKLRRSFCHKCNNYFKTENRKIRIKNGKISIKCLNCGAYVRYKINKTKRR